MPNTYIIVPAAGGGRRMQHSTAKQYLTLAGKPILEHTLATLLAVPDIQQVLVALSLDDQQFNHLPSAKHPRLMTLIGGNSRAESVLNALQSLSAVATAQDWILVHDGARPLVSLSDIAQLRHLLIDHPIGGILATPVTDTLKQVNAEQQIQTTLARETLWRALTPQLCRYGLLTHALKHCLNQQIAITDEAMALEQCGHSLQVVEGSSDNIKITYPIDLALAEQVLLLRAERLLI